MSTIRERRQRGELKASPSSSSTAPMTIRQKRVETERIVQQEKDKIGHQMMKDIGMDWTSQVKRGIAAPAAAGDPLSLHMGPISRETFNTEMDRRSRQGTITAGPVNNFSIDDLVLSRQGNREARERVERSRYSGLSEQERAIADRMADERAGELRRLGHTVKEDYSIPVLGGVVRSLDRLADVTKPFADLAQEYYTPGAGLSAINAITQGAGYGVAKALPSLANSPVGRIAQTALTEAIAGAPLEAANSLTRTGDLKQAAKDGLIYGAGGGALLGGLGRGVAEGVKTIRQRRLTQAVDDFVGRTQEPQEAPVHPSERIVSELPSSIGANKADEYAGNLRRWENIQQEYNKAVEDQYQLLRQQMDERGGVTQGNIVRDAEGNVVDRTGRVSNNPQWYRDFFTQTGRKPSQKELRELAEQQVKNGYADDAGQIPPWKPAEISDIDGELASIREMMDNVSEPSERAALQQVASTLESSRSQIKQQLPEGVNARLAPGVKAMAQSQPSPKSSTVTTTSSPQIGGAANQQSINTPTTPVIAKKTISRTQLVNNIKHKLGVTVDTGRTGYPAKTLGVYKIKPEVIRTATAQDYDTIAHEIGHHFVKKHNIADPQFERELTDMMDTIGEHDYKKYPQNQWLDEGVAEYMRVYLSNPAKARQLAPKFSAFLDSKLPKDVRKALVSVQKDIKTWLDQGEYNQAKGMIDSAGETQAVGSKRSRMYTRFFDDLHPIELMEKALKGVVGLGSRSIYKLARLSRGVGEQAKMAMTRGIFDSQGNKLSDGLRTIVEPLEKVGMSQDDFATYLAVVHARDLVNLGKEVPFTYSQMDEVIKRWSKNPVVQKAQQQIVQYNNALMDILVEAQIFDSNTVAALRQKYPNYVPFLRYFDDDAVAGFKNGGYGSSSGFANITNPVKRMSEEGSSRTIINPLESMVQNTFLTMNAAAKNKVGLQLADLSKIDGAGAWVEHVPGGSSSKEHIVNVWQNGKRQAYKVRDPELYNALLSLDHESANGVVKFVGGIAGMLRAGATLTPEFMVRNAFRDVMGAIINSTKYGFNPLDFFKGLFHVVTNSDVFEKFVNSGGAMSTMMALDRNANREALETVFKQSLKDSTMNVVTSPKELAKFLAKYGTGYGEVRGVVKLLRKGAEISELSTKVGAFNKTLKKTGDIAEAAYTARDLMDFNRAGTSTRQWNRMTAFLNASLQGTDKMARAFKENKLGFMIRAFTTLVLPAAGIYYLNDRLPPEMKEKYENIPQWQKDSFFVIGDPGTGEFIRIPKPFEAGMLFATSTERMLDWLKKNDPEAFKGYGRATLESFAPPVLFTALNPLIEGLTNHSIFRNAPIVPQGEQRLEKKDQYGVYTSELAKEIGSFFDSIGMGGSNIASPRIIDNTIKGYTAGLGAYGVDLVDKGIETVRGDNPVAQPAKKWTEDPFFRSFFVSTAGGGQIRDDFYSRWEKLEKAKASADFNEIELPKDQADEIARMKPYQKQISKWTKEYKEIQRSKELSAEQKRSKLDELDAKMNEAARLALGK